MKEQRRTKRFELKLPLELVGSGGYTIGAPCETKNLSSSGVLFRTTENTVNVGDCIEYRITLSGSSTTRPVRLHCRGKVVRRQVIPGETTNIAATLERYEFVRTDSAESGH